MLSNTLTETLTVGSSVGLIPVISRRGPPTSCIAASVTGKIVRMHTSANSDLLNAPSLMRLTPANQGVAHLLNCDNLNLVWRKCNRLPQRMPGAYRPVRNGVAAGRHCNPGWLTPDEQLHRRWNRRQSVGFRRRAG